MGILGSQVGSAVCLHTRAVYTDLITFFCCWVCISALKDSGLSIFTSLKVGKLRWENASGWNGAGSPGQLRTVRLRVLCSDHATTALCNNNKFQFIPICGGKWDHSNNSIIPFSGVGMHPIKRCVRRNKGAQSLYLSSFFFLCWLHCFSTPTLKDFETDVAVYWKETSQGGSA